MNYVEDVNYCRLEREKVAEFESEKKTTVAITLADR